MIIGWKRTHPPPMGFSEDFRKTIAVQIDQHNCQDFIFSQWSSSFGKAPPHSFKWIWFCFRNNSVWPLEKKGHSEDLYQRPNSSLPLFPRQWQPNVKKGWSWSLQQHVLRYQLRFVFFPALNFMLRNSLRVSFSLSRSFETTKTLSFPVYFFHSLPSSTNQS